VSVTDAWREKLFTYLLVVRKTSGDEIHVEMALEQVLVKRAELHALLAPSAAESSVDKSIIPVTDS